MKFCVALSFSDTTQYLPLARAADEAGYDSLACSDHLVNPEVLTKPYPYAVDGSRRWEPFTHWPDAWVAIAAMAAVTEQIRFFTNVYALPLRNPFAVAKAVATAAVLSGDRVALGAGMGSMEDEFRIVGSEWRGRGARADEMIEVMRKLWTPGWAEHHGEHYDFERLEMSPAPSEPVPIYIGGLSDVALRRAARNDGWISDLHSAEEITSYCKRLGAERSAIGRDQAPFAVIAACNDAVDYDGYKRLEEIGVTHLLTLPWIFYSGWTTDLRARIEGLHRFADDILARF